MKKLILFMMLLVATLSLVNYTVYADTTVIAGKPLSVSFVQMGHTAKFKLIDAKTNTYRLTLTRANPFITYFSDRPARVIGQVSNQEFLAKWSHGSDSFAKDAPNAVLDGSIRDDQQKKHFMNIAMILSAPTYDSDTQRFTYHVRIIPSSVQGALLPAMLYHPVMFIDNACLTCVG